MFETSILSPSTSDVAEATSLLAAAITTAFRASGLSASTSASVGFFTSATPSFTEAIVCSTARVSRVTFFGPTTAPSSSIYFALAIASIACCSEFKRTPIAVSLSLNTFCATPALTYSLYALEIAPTSLTPSPVGVVVFTAFCVSKISTSALLSPTVSVATCAGLIDVSFLPSTRAIFCPAAA